MNESFLETDQEDMASRLSYDAVFLNTVTVFAQRRGITENDIQTALGATNSTNGLAGSVAIVLMPKLVPETPGAPGPSYYTRYAVQVIDWPTMRRVPGGSGLSAETLAERVRTILHWFTNRPGQTLYFDGMEPAPMLDQTQVSYIIYFRKITFDKPPPKVAAVLVTPNGGASPQTVTLTCATASSSVYYTTDGSYPSSRNAAAVLYSAPFNQPVAATLRAAAELAGYAGSDVSTSIFT